MAYAARQGSERITSVVAVAGIHAAIGAALIIGLAPPIIEIMDPTILTTFDAKDETKVEPPKPTTEKQPQTSIVTTGNQPIDINTAGPTVETTLIDDNIPIVIPTAEPTRLPIAEPTQSHPLFTPKRPQPINASNSWVTTDDYPSGDLRRGHEGTVGYRLVIGTNGKVQSCDVTASSGWPGLDEAACKNVSRRARFEAGTNNKGEKVVDTYSGRVIWRIPE